LAQGEVLQDEIRARAEGHAQRTKDAEEQGRHHRIMHDGELAWPGALAIVVTVGKQDRRMTPWRTTTFSG
jgi:hypothetical protein